MSADMSVEVAWAAVQTFDGKPALSVVARYVGVNGIAERREHVIPAADIARFVGGLSIWNLIEVAIEPAVEAQARIAEAQAKRDDRLNRNRRAILLGSSGRAALVTVDGKPLANMAVGSSRVH